MHIRLKIKAVKNLSLAALRLQCTVVYSLSRKAGAHFQCGYHWEICQQFIMVSSPSLKATQRVSVHKADLAC